MSNYLFVIGIDTYASPQISNLNNAVADAKKIHQILTERYGFELFPQPLFNVQATKENIYQGFTQLVATLQEEDNLIIYFSGHGRMHPLTSKGYWIPYDANDTTVDFVENSVIKDFIETIRAKHIFLIADSCFSGTFLSTTRGYVKESKYADLYTKKSRWMLASGGEEPVSDGAKGGHSPFAKNLIEFLEQNTNKYTSIEEIAKYVSALTTSEAKQKPVGAYIQNIGHEGGQLVLNLSENFVATSIDITKGRPNTEVLLKKYRKLYKAKSKIAAGKDVLIIESFVDDVDFLIFELFRFDDSGKRRIIFQHDSAMFETEKGESVKWNVVQRFATFDSLNKFLEEREQLFKDKKIIIWGANSEIDGVEDAENVIDHKEFLQDLFEMNVTPMRCLHCSNMITTNDSYLVEIDEEGLKNNIGNVHNGCLRPLDRIVGRAIYPNAEESNLISFNYDTWQNLLEKGQGIVTGAKNSTEQAKIFSIAWNRKHNFNTGEFCIKVLLDDGSFTYVHLGKEIHRFKANEIDNDLALFNNDIDESKGEDAYGYTSEKRTFGKISRLKKVKLESESILRIIKYEKARYSAQLDIKGNIENDYSPLGIVINIDSNEVFSMGNCIPLISNPSQFDAFHQNWNEAGYVIGKCTLRIIESDKDFDLYIISWLDEGMQPIIDPLFDSEKELTGGIYIQDIEALNGSKQPLHSGSLIENPKWRAGDRVKVIFPEGRKDKFPEGTLMTDELEDEEGKRRVIFCPIVDGVQRPDLAVSMPSKFLEVL